ncbi:hypothetical protein BC831DRAFT_464852 [Entophlyctis helioformis]|nr:hypothetical protein BC831DRAFT_464852 [Entophlyctis helioformis]
MRLLSLLALPDLCLMRLLELADRPARLAATCKRLAALWSLVSVQSGWLLGHTADTQSSIDVCVRATKPRLAAYILSHTTVSALWLAHWLVDVAATPIRRSRSPCSPSLSQPRPRSGGDMATATSHANNQTQQDSAQFAWLLIQHGADRNADMSLYIRGLMVSAGVRVYDDMHSLERYMMLIDACPGVLPAGLVALYQSCWAGNTCIVRLLARCRRGRPGADGGSTGDTGDPGGQLVDANACGAVCLMVACMEGHDDVVKCLVTECGVQAHVRDRLASKLASRCGHEQIAAFLDSCS